MKIEKQGTYECTLATIAALANVQLRSVREFACKRANIDKWEYVIRKSGDEFWEIIGDIAKHYKVNGMPKELSYSNTPLLTAGGKEQLQGRGSISIQSSAHMYNHTMAFENGVVYDPDCPTYPLAISKLMQTRYKDWVVTDVSKE